MNKKTKIIAIICAVLLIALIVPSIRQALFDYAGNYFKTTDSESGQTVSTDVLVDLTDQNETEEQQVNSQNDPPDTEPSTQEPDTNEIQTTFTIDENGSYDDKDSVALYIHTYGKLPPNYISKSEAEALGWEGGSVENYAPGKCIGGTYFGNYENLLPKKSGRKYYECDIDTLGKSSRGAKRIIYSNDGLIYYTDDHYETFELLYGEE